MALKDLKSRFDRHTIQDPAVPPAQLAGNPVSGPTGEGPIPSEGSYFSDNRTSDSPFDTVRGQKMDQMVQMLANTTTSGNSGLTYGPAPGGTENSPFQDLDGTTPLGYVHPS